MKKEFKRETKIAIFTYGCIATIYIGILYIFSMFLFPNIFGLSKVFDMKTIMLFGFVFVATLIGVYKGTKGIKDNYIKAISIFAIPTIIVLLFKDTIPMAVILLLVCYMVSGIYKVTPKATKSFMKILKLITIVVIVATLILSIGLILGQILNRDIYNMTISLNLEKNIALMVAGILFMSFATKEVIKEVLVKYKPTDREIGSLISGTVVLFFVMVVLTSLVQYTYKLNNQENVMYDILLGLFSLFILIEIYEEIRIIQMLKKKEKVKIEEK